jgi:regulator of CtrA degradation
MQSNTATLNTANLMFLPAIYNETLKLLTDTHEYFYLYGEQDQKRLETEAVARSFYSYEMSRITLRLSSIMAWVLLRRAVHGGKISEEEAKSKQVLECQDICLHENAEANAALPSYMQSLLTRSLELYKRICRLDNQSQALA